MKTGTTHWLLEGSPYLSYAYAYPHKTAYRRFPSPQPLSNLWESQSKDRLLAYLHFPLCEKRCGFCNLFTLARPPTGWAKGYLDALELQAHQVSEALGPTRHFAEYALGGGTPTLLSPQELERAFNILNQLTRVPSSSLIGSVEVSPQTIDAEKLSVLRVNQVSRVSIGIQSFNDEETRNLGRHGSRRESLAGLEALRKAGFPCLNIDLIYGGRGQTLSSWRETLETAIHFNPEELYLYPLYVRNLTDLSRDPAAWDDHRLNLYRAGRDLLLTRGYTQLSMRAFRRAKPAPSVQNARSCQEDGMVGLGCGARSYTDTLHYSDEYSVSRAGILEIVARFMQRSPEQHRFAFFGVTLDQNEQLRRYVLKSLLRMPGLSSPRFQQRFGGDPLILLPELYELLDCGLARWNDRHISLTPVGLERSDRIGPWLTSSGMTERMETFVWR